MNIYYTGSNKNLSSATGKLTAKIHNNFKFTDFDGTVTRFITNGEQVVLFTRHQISETEWNDIPLRFPVNIENKRYEFQSDGILQPPIFSENWDDPDGGSWHRPYYPKMDVGHITFDFNFEVGTLKATFNFTIMDGITSHQVIGEINVEGLEHAKTGQRHLEKLFE
ncbi:hypothetical protein [Pseudomonas lini]|uniref:Uncharacterized protein n=1 Tax=Pseudomonas lini TaxID=163011 RepID=A0A0J6H640_9PSED|nr:hypothetical protein [Pseudomonas lini]KAB0501445.1 hypothetical protein F7R14_21685 [Pseudomonas lini]KMM89943.1 hypothetical protein TU81_22265 [Pseudomonas lini]SDR83191.1 hypothetical protein SAMN04490191_0051 [Pseudomonas lini]